MKPRKAKTKERTTEGRKAKTKERTTEGRFLFKERSLSLKRKRVYDWQEKTTLVRPKLVPNSVGETATESAHVMRG